MIKVQIFSDCLYINILSLNSDTVAELIGTCTSRGCEGVLKCKEWLKITGHKDSLYSFLFEVTCCYAILME